jgi:hypothetical protein
VGITIDGHDEQIHGITTRSFLEDPTLKLSPEDCRPRSGAITSIVLHTTKGIPGGKDKRRQEIRPGFGAPVGAGARAASCWRDDGRAGGAHLVVDFDGSVTCHADLVRTTAYHAGAANARSIGIEIYQGSRAELYAGQLEVVVALVDWLTLRFGVQRAIPAGYLGGPIARLELGAVDFSGVFGHRDCSSNRGAGDPGDEVFRLLAAAGYERWDIEARQDVAAWKSRQQQLGLTADGVPGPRTRAALAAAGRRGGLWVSRPADVATLDRPLVA